MKNQIWSLLLLVVFHFALVSCRKDYYDYYNSTNVENMVTAEEDSTTLDPTEEDILQNADNAGAFRSDYYQRDYVYYQRESYNTMLAIAISVSVGGALIFVGVLCCLRFCCPQCCRKMRPGFVLRPNTTNVSTYPPNQQPVFLQHTPPEQGMTQHPPSYSANVKY